MAEKWWRAELARPQVSARTKAMHAPLCIAEATVGAAGKTVLSALPTGSRKKRRDTGKATDGPDQEWAANKPEFVRAAGLGPRSGEKPERP